MGVRLLSAAKEVDRLVGRICGVCFLWRGGKVRFHSDCKDDNEMRLLRETG